MGFKDFNLGLVLMFNFAPWRLEYLDGIIHWEENPRFMMLEVSDFNFIPWKFHFSMTFLHFSIFNKNYHMGVKEDAKQSIFLTVIDREHFVQVNVNEL